MQVGFPTPGFGLAPPQLLGSYSVNGRSLSRSPFASHSNKLSRKRKKRTTGKEAKNVKVGRILTNLVNDAIFLIRKFRSKTLSTQSQLCISHWVILSHSVLCLQKCEAIGFPFEIINGICYDWLGLAIPST